jgi:hypothetical protein
LIRRERAALIALFVLPQIALLLWTWLYWGNLGGALTLERAPFSWNALRMGWLGQLVDRENGLLVWAPIYLFLPLAWVIDWRRNWPWLLPAASLFLISAAHDQWWGGFSPAARFLVPLIPVFTFVGTVLVRDTILRRAHLTLLVPQVLISAIGWDSPRWLWPQGDGHNRVLSAILESVGASERLLPSLRSTVADMSKAGAWLALVGAANACAWVMSSVNRARGDPTSPQP